MPLESVLPSLWPLPVVVAGGAGAVMGTAAALSGWAAHHPTLKAQRWSRPLPRWLRGAIDVTGTRRVLGGIGILATAAGLITLARRSTAVDGLNGLAIVTATSLVAGPVWRYLNPVRIGLPPQPVGDPLDADVRPAAVWLAALGLVALSTGVGTVLAATAAAYLAAQRILASRIAQPRRRHDAVEVLTELMSHLAPVGRAASGELAWRNPLVAATHASLPHGALLTTAVVVGISATHALGGARTTAAPGLTALATAAPLLVVTTATAGTLMHLAMIRQFFRSAVLPVAAAYGLVAAGRWWPPVDLLVFVGLHVVAVAMLHRQALARHDLRTARALQFPPRLLLVVSVTCGLALLAGG